MRVLGLDISLSSPGLALIEDGVLVYSTHLSSDTSTPWFDRIKALVNRVSELIDFDYSLSRVDTIYMENYSFNSKFDRETLAEVHGVVMWELTKLGLPYHKIAPRQLKLFLTGQGNTPPVPEGVAKSTWGKRWIVEEVNTQYDKTFKLSQNDEVDAFLVGLVGYYVEMAKAGAVLDSLKPHQQKVIQSIINPTVKTKGGKKNGRKRTDRVEGSGQKQPVKRSRVNSKKLDGG